MSRFSTRARAGAAALLVAGSVGCASTQATTTMQYGGRLPRPQRILVYQFATSPEEVKLDRSPTAVVAWKIEGISATAEQVRVGQAVAAALADTLV